MKESHARRAFEERDFERRLVRAEVIDVADDDNVLVRLGRATTEEVFRAEIAVISYSPEGGDRVLVEQGEDAWFVVGALGAARHRAGPTMGLTATRDESGGLELRVPHGDLTLAAEGRI